MATRLFLSVPGGGHSGLSVAAQGEACPWGLLRSASGEEGPSPFPAYRPSREGTNVPCSTNSGGGTEHSLEGFGAETTV